MVATLNDKTGWDQKCSDGLHRRCKADLCRCPCHDGLDVVSETIAAMERADEVMSRPPATVTRLEPKKRRSKRALEDLVQEAADAETPEGVQEAIAKMDEVLDVPLAGIGDGPGQFPGPPKPEPVVDVLLYGVQKVVSKLAEHLRDDWDRALGDSPEEAIEKYLAAISSGDKADCPFHGRDDHGRPVPPVGRCGLLCTMRPR